MVVELAHLRYAYVPTSPVETPAVALATCSVVIVVTVAALPVQDAELPVTLIPQEPDAPVPVLVGASSAT